MSSSAGARHRKNRGGPVLLALLAVALLAGAVFAANAYYANVREQARVAAEEEARRQLIWNAVHREVIYEGVVVDGVPLGGLTLDQARAKLQSREQAVLARVALSAAYQSQTFPITAEDIGYRFDTDDVLKQAWNVARTGSDESRYEEIQRVAREGYQISVTRTFSRNLLRAAADRIADQLDQDAVNATCDGFDEKALTFHFTEGEPGLAVNRDKLYDDLVAAVDADNVTARLSVTADVVPPAVSVADLDGKFGMMATFTTTTTNVAARNSNINIATQAINLKMVLPGEVFSVNAATGARTADKGYQEAGAYRNGKLVPEFGGGVCQVSSTFFNALIRSGLQVTERNNHSLTVSYVPLGHDAAIDGLTKKDLKFLNTTDYPVWIVAHFENRKLSFALYGCKILEPGVELDMRTEILLEIPPGPPATIVDLALKPGEKVVDTAAHTGYKTVTYLVTKKDGKVVSEVQLHKSDYAMATQVTHVGPASSTDSSIGRR